MPDAIDARGLSCPEPSDLAYRALAGRRAAALRILVDDPASREQLERLARQFDYTMRITRAGDHDDILLERRGA